MSTTITNSPRSGQDYLRTIAAMTIVLELTMRKMKEIRERDARAHHVAALGHIRTALDYERKVLHELMDPKGMAALTAEAMKDSLGMLAAEAIVVLEENQGDNDENTRTRDNSTGRNVSRNLGTGR